VNTQQANTGRDANGFKQGRLIRFLSSLNTEHRLVRRSPERSRRGEGGTLNTLFALLTLLLAAGAYAADWKTDGNGNWNNNANWQNPGTYPNGVGAVADFSKLNITAERTITLGTSIKVGSIILGDTTAEGSPATYKAYVFSAGNTLTMDVSSGSATITQNVNSAENTFNQAIALDDDLVIVINSLKNLEFYGAISPIIAGTRTVTIQGVAPSGDAVASMVGFRVANTFAKLVVKTGGIVNLSTGGTPDLGLGAVPGSFTADAVTLDGGSLRRAGAGTLTIHQNRGITITANGGHLSAAHSNRLIVVDSVITGPGSLSISGGDLGVDKLGIVTLNKANTYSGNTIVTNGTLRLAVSNALPPTTELRLLSTGINTNGKMDLAFSSGEGRISALYFDGVKQPNGTWGFTGSGANHISTTWFTGGTGKLRVGNERIGTMIIFR
jgi:autotransporter-associated beta strand protein